MSLNNEQLKSLTEKIQKIHDKEPSYSQVSESDYQIFIQNNVDVLLLGESEFRSTLNNETFTSTTKYGL